jgi:hypothetical protein
VRAVKDQNGSGIAIAEPPGVLGNRLKDGLDLGRRLADHAQDLARGGLLLQRLGEVAVTSLQLREQPHVLDGDDRLVREGLYQRDDALGKGSHLGPDDRDDADAHALPHHRHDQLGPIAQGVAEQATVLGHRWLLPHVREVQGGAALDCLADCPRRLGETPWVNTPELLQRLLVHAVLGNHAHKVAIELIHPAVDAVAQAHAALGDGVEHRLHVSLRLTDHAQDLARGRLLAQRLCQIAIALSQLREEPHILDGDDGLIGEGLQEGDLPLAERPDLGAPDGDRSDGNALPHQGYPEHRAVPHLSRDRASLGELPRLGGQIVHVDGPGLEHGPAVDGSPDDRDRVFADGPRADRPTMGDFP